MKVEILTRKLIRPSSPTPPHHAKQKISCFDQMYPPIYSASILYYQATTVNHAEISRQLQKSLSQTITLFFPLAGRFNEEDLSIDCNDKGVDYLEAQVSGSLSQLIREGELLISLVPSLIQPQGSPLIMIQVNMFEDGGIAIGVCGYHRVADGFTAFTFIDAWVTTCRFGIEKVHCRPSFELSSLCPPRDAVPFLELAEDDKELVTRRFMFDAKTLSKLKAAAANVADADGLKLLKREPTPTDVVTAVIWRALIMISRARNGCMRPSISIFPINMRQRTNLPVAKYSYGNFICLAIARFMPDDDSEEVPLHELVRLVHDAKTSVLARCAKASGSDELYLMQENTIKEINAAGGEEGEMDVFVFSSWSKFPVYESDFGFGKPESVSPADIPMENMVCCLDNKDGEGMEAWVTLEEKNIPLFQRNLIIDHPNECVINGKIH